MSFFEFPHTRTYDRDLGWLIKQCQTNEEAIETINKWVLENEPKIEDFEKLIEDLENGNIPEGIKEGIEEWCRLNIYELMSESLKGVYFALTQDGHFVAYYPTSWSDITFNTTELDIHVPGVDYGHLTLSY